MKTPSIPLALTGRIAWCDVHEETANAPSVRMREILRARTPLVVRLRAVPLKLPHPTERRAAALARSTGVALSTRSVVVHVVVIRDDGEPVTQHERADDR